MTNPVFAAVLLSAMLTVSAARRAEAQIGPGAGVSVCVPLRSGGSIVELQADVSAPLSDDWAAGAFVLYYPVGFRFTVGVAVLIGRTRP